MKRMIGGLLLLLIFCASAPGKSEMLLSSELGDLRAAVTEGEDGFLALELAWAEEPTVRYARLIPQGIAPEALSLSLTPDAPHPNVRLYIEREGEEGRDYFAFSRADGVWGFAHAWFAWAGDRYSVDLWRDGAHAGQMVISRSSESHSLFTGHDALDMQPDTMTLDAFRSEASRLKLEAEAQTEAALLTKLAARFPGEDLAGVQVTGWSSLTVDGREAAFVAVERAYITDFYLMNDWPDVPQNARLACASQIGIEDVRVEVEIRGEDGVYRAGASYAKGEERFGFSLRTDKDMRMQAVSCYRERQEESGWWEVTLGAPYAVVYPGRFLNSLNDLLCEMPQHLREIETFDPAQVLAWAEAAYDDYRNGEPPIIPVNETAAVNFPQPVEASLRRGKHAVYSGPGKGYRREANGRASVSSGDWVQIFGREGDWALIQYRVSGGKLRVGYVHREAVRDFEALPQLHFERVALRQDNGFVTSDPMGEAGWIELTGEPYEMTRLCTLGECWMYVELVLPGGDLARMFAEIEPSHG